MKLPILFGLAFLGIINCNAPNPIPKQNSITRINSRYEISSKDIKVKYLPLPPPYPQIAKKARIDGDVVLKISIDSEGLPLSIRAIEGPYELRKSAESYLLQWRFYPVTIGGKSQPTTFLFTLPYRLQH